MPSKNLYVPLLLVSGRPKRLNIKQLKIMKKPSQIFVALFFIIIHLPAPFIYYKVHYSSDMSKIRQDIFISRDLAPSNS